MLINEVIAVITSVTLNDFMLANNLAQSRATLKPEGHANVLSLTIHRTHSYMESNRGNIT